MPTSPASRPLALVYESGSPPMQLKRDGWTRAILRGDTHVRGIPASTSRVVLDRRLPGMLQQAGLPP